MILAASGVLLKDHKILLLKRSNYTKNYPGCWGCPGGRAEDGETPEQVVIREVKEECNLDFVPGEIIKTGIWQDRKFYRFLGSWNGSIKIQEEEVLEYKWFTYEEAIQLEFSFDYKEVVQLLRNNGHI